MLAFLFGAMEIHKFFKIGYVIKAHGLKGEITIALTPECPALAGLKSVFIEFRSQLVPHFIESASTKGNKAFVKLEDVTSHELASSLKGRSLYLPKSKLPKLHGGEFYTDEVLGFKVTDLEEGVLGYVKGVFETGPNRHLVVIHNKKEILIPINGPFIKGVNKTKKEISVELPNGFLDI